MLVTRVKKETRPYGERIRAALSIVIGQLSETSSHLSSFPANTCSPYHTVPASRRIREPPFSTNLIPDVLISPFLLFSFSIRFFFPSPSHFRPNTSYIIKLSFTGPANATTHPIRVLATSKPRALGKVCGVNLSLTDSALLGRIS